MRIMSCVLIGLIVISLGSTVYTQQMKSDEVKRNQDLLEKKNSVEQDITGMMSSLSEIAESSSETASLILEEQKKQKDIEDDIRNLTADISELEEVITLYERLDRKDPRVLITVDDPVVMTEVEEITRLCKTTEEKQQAIFEYVRKEIVYVTEGNPKRYSYPQPFLEFKSDYWQLPRETIEWGSGDCEDLSVLLCTMMRAAGCPPSDVRVCVGLLQYWGGRGHAWIEFKLGGTWYALEATCPTCNYIEKTEYYSLLIPQVWGWFNDREYHDMTASSPGGRYSFWVQ